MIGKSNPILEVNNFSLDLNASGQILPVLNDINFSIHKGEILSLVGESGCGKSICALALTKLLPKNLGIYKSGSVIFNGVSLLEVSPSDLQNIRGNDIAYIFQEPFSSLNPLHKIEKQMLEGFLIHNKGSKKEGIEKAEYLLRRVGITDIKDRMNSYPNQMSGGMLQRISIAMALMCDPILLIADEPTSAIDVTIQSQLMELLFELKEDNDLAVLFISHDIGLVSNISDRIQVMYAGCIMESGSVEQVIDSPKHPYTEALLRSYPSVNEKVLEPIPGIVPSPSQYPTGCYFSDRCRYVKNICKSSKPVPKIQNKENSKEHTVYCFLYDAEENSDVRS